MAKTTFEEIQPRKKYQPKKENTNTLFIKNMVCRRCVITVEEILRKLHISFTDVRLGTADLSKKPSLIELKEVDRALHEVGFELIATRINKIIEDIKRLILDYINLGMESQQFKLSSHITKQLAYDYSYLSDLFSSVEGKTIEQYFIFQRIEKVKELIVYDQLSLTEISYETGFSSVHHLSSQFKKITGLTPSHFKKIGINKRRFLDMP